MADEGHDPNVGRLGSCPESAHPQIIILTGPNMAGKSTYLRQVALIAIMAQVGSFVPAESARIGVVDKVFTRIGASDDLARGVSTFLAEMTETANILNNATSRSLVILDEVGRGTSTNDGLALAWAAVEYLHGRETARTKDEGQRTNSEPARPRTLFATHYHELTDITQLLPRARNYSFQVREQKDTVLFLRKLKQGPADKSYGIAVARLAGLPREVIERAEQVLAVFEARETMDMTEMSAISDRVPSAALAADAPSGAAPRADSGSKPGIDRQSAIGDWQSSHPVLEQLREADLDHLSPIEAFNLLLKLKRDLAD
jgi:DNA mismatch repair protein MutS